MEAENSIIDSETAKNLCDFTWNFAATLDCRLHTMWVGGNAQWRILSPCDEGSGGAERQKPHVISVRRRDLPGSSVMQPHIEAVKHQGRIRDNQIKGQINCRLFGHRG